jgi:hypothetical protein
MSRFALGMGHAMRSHEQKGRNERKPTHSIASQQGHGTSHFHNFIRSHSILLLCGGFLFPLVDVCKDLPSRKLFCTQATWLKTHTNKTRKVQKQTKKNASRSQWCTENCGTVGFIAKIKRRISKTKHDLNHGSMP